MLVRWKGGRSERGKEASFLSVLRRIAGMPDYKVYLAHLRDTHPERAVPTEREFYAEFVRNRYGDSPTRCC